MNKTTTLSTLLMVTLLLTSLLSQSAYSGEFKFNNKNLNALMALICQSSSSSQNQYSIYAHKLSVGKTKLGSQTNQVSYELTGTCNIEYSKKSKEIIAYGEEFIVELNLSDINSAAGKIGIKDIKFNFQKGILKGLSITDPLLLTEKSFNLAQSKWALTDSIFNFNSKKLFSLKIGRKTAAIEDNSVLSFKNEMHSQFFNTWSFESFGCSMLNANVSEQTCTAIMNKIK